MATYLQSNPPNVVFSKIVTLARSGGIFEKRELRICVPENCHAGSVTYGFVFLKIVALEA